ncbi:unnamed protein product [Tilletia controversa]|nr:unnamed protein product [Tilletia controversa]
MHIHKYTVPASLEPLISLPARARARIRSRGVRFWVFCLPLVVRAAIGRINLPLINLRSNLNAFLEAVMTTTQTTTHPASDSAAGAAAPLQRFGSSGKPGFSIAGRRSPQELKKTMGMIDHIHLSSTQGPGVRLKLTDVL